MTILCTCEAQLQPHEWMLNVCPEPREVHDRKLAEWRLEMEEWRLDYELWPGEGD
jgi:hypothetical protein